jgi:hypothetical protein
MAVVDVMLVDPLTGEVFFIGQAELIGDDVSSVVRVWPDQFVAPVEVSLWPGRTTWMGRAVPAQEPGWFAPACDLPDR